MALRHLRSSTANKRPLPSGLADGQLAVNTEQTSPGLFFKNASGSLVKVGPVHVGATAPNASPASGGETGNTIGEQWLDTSGTNPVLKIWDGSGWASEAGEFVNASGDTMTGALVMDNQQQVRFRETTANGTNFIAIQAPASVSSDKTLTLPDVTGTLVSTGDTGTVTSTMIADGTIVDADVNASAAIAGTKISPDFGSQNVVTTGTSTAASLIPTGSTVPTNGVYLPSANTVGVATNGSQRLLIDGSGQIESAGLGTAAAPAWSFVSDPNTGIYSPGADQLAVATNGAQRLTVDTAATTSTLPVVHPLGAVGTPSITFTGDLNTGFYSPGADTLAAVTAGANRLHITSTGLVGIGSSSPRAKIEITDGTTNTAGEAVNEAYIVGATTASSEGIVTIQSNDAIAADKGGSLAFGGRAVSSSTSGANWAFINGYKENSSSGQFGGYLAFSTRPNAGSIAERLRITSTGAVGIGTTSPVSTLHVNASNAQLRITGVTNTSGLLLAVREDGQDVSILSTGSNGGIRFSTNPSGGAVECARLTADGKLLVGTSSKSATASTTAKGIVGIGGGGGIICAEGQIANNGTIDITVGTSGIHYFTGLLQVNNISASNGANRTQSLISILGDNQGGTISTSTLHTANGSGSRSFTITYVATGILRFTNNSGDTCNVQITYMGGGINAS